MKLENVNGKLMLITEADWIQCAKLIGFDARIGYERMWLSRGYKRGSFVFETRDGIEIPVRVGDVIECRRRILNKRGVILDIEKEFYQVGYELQRITAEQASAKDWKRKGRRVKIESAPRDLTKSKIGV